MQRQLSIFDSLEPLDTAQCNLKPGDWVKLRRKTVSAAYWKKGEVVQIEAVHPVNGSGRFWNERANDWAYLHPDDVIKTEPPIGIVPPSAIAPVTELEPAADVTELAVEPVVTELEPAPGDVHSVTDCPIALVTELAVAPVVTELEGSPGDVYSITGPVATYKPKGTAGAGEYFRFSYRDRNKVRHIHIPGGNTGNILAQQRAAEVMELFAAGTPLQDLIDLIRSWSTRRHRET